MDKREMVIKGLESIHAVSTGSGEFYVNNFHMGDFNALLKYALELLKASAPIDHEAGEIIDDLQQQIDWICNIKGHQFPGWGHTVLAMNRAIRELKAQEPRVMTLEEAANAECVFYDWRTRGVRPAKVTRVPYKTGTYRVQRFGDIDDWVHADEYGEYWRCWTGRPTDEQREAEAWA